VYDHDEDELEILGWDEFIIRQWGSIFAGYRQWAGLRRIGRRWSDLFEAGLGCSQQTADLLVRAEVIDRADRDLHATSGAGALVQAMLDIVAGLPGSVAELTEAGEIPSAAADALRDGQARLLAFLRLQALGLGDPGSA